MTEAQPQAVRPTIRCLVEDLGEHPPTVDTPLHTVSHPLIKKAQLLPARSEGGAITRIRELQDRWWLSVKIRGAGWRGAVTAGRGLLGEWAIACRDYWWLGAAGMRDDDSKHDFYRVIASHSTSDWMLPVQLDAMRIKAEVAYADVVAIRERICGMLVESLMSNRVLTAEYRSHTLSVFVRAPDGETYVSVGTLGIPNPEVFAVLLDSVPGTERDGWLPEPSPHANLQPRSGEIIYSNIIEPQALAELCAAYPPGTLDVSE